MIEIREVLRGWLDGAVREVLRGWLDGAGLRIVAERAGVDRKTARRYVQAAQEAGLERAAGLDAVVAAVRPTRPGGHGPAWERLVVCEEQIRVWVAGDGKDAKPLSIVKIEELLARQGCVVPYRTLHRFAAERCGYRAKGTTVRVNDGEPGAELQVDFGHMGASKISQPFLKKPQMVRDQIESTVDDRFDPGQGDCCLPLAWGALRELDDRVDRLGPPSR